MTGFGLLRRRRRFGRDEWAGLTVTALCRRRRAFKADKPDSAGREAIPPEASMLIVPLQAFIADYYLPPMHGGGFLLLIQLAVAVN